MTGVGIFIFPDPGFHCIALESAIRPYRPKTRHLSWTYGTINLYVLVWALYNLLGTSAKVRARAESIHKTANVHYIFSRSLNGALSTTLYYWLIAILTTSSRWKHRGH
jgi:hypothetical protein